MIRVPIVRLDEGLPVPSRRHPGDAGYDLYAAADQTIPPGERSIVGTGVAIAIPDGYVGLVTPRSGLAASSGLSIVNAPGVIDAGYRGEVKLILVNLDHGKAIVVRRGDRVAQLLIVPLAAAELHETDVLPESVRGTGGFGSSGT